MSIYNRIKETRKENKLSQQDFANKLGINRGLYSMIELGKSNPTIDVITQIANIFCKSYEWLIEGKNITKNSSISQLVVTVDTQGNENIIFVPVKASAGYLNGYADPEYIHQLPAYRLPGISNGVFRMFEISGQSMQETLEDGDRVVGEWVHPDDIKDGKVYIIVSKADGICVKRCINRLKSDNRLILQSDNKEFDNIIIEAEDILEAWSAKLRITSKFNNPSETISRFADLEARVTFLEHNILNKP